MKRGTTDPGVKEIIISLKKSKSYTDLVRLLERPRRKRPSINLKDIEKSGKHKVAAVEVLGIGEVSRPFIVYALRYSGSAKEKIEKAGGKALSLNDLLRNKDEAVLI
ncbi:MAG: uL15 family ribosomal protein [Candidatus Aenigmarchaeota archaeon]|nr:uL15 family ribosomal protein [Candidatus Aenigmarchaeota archaeon]